MIGNSGEHLQAHVLLIRPQLSLVKSPIEAAIALQIHSGYSVLAASLPTGDMPSVCQPQTVLPYQLALFSDHLSVPPEIQGPQNLQNGPRLPPQAAMVSSLTRLCQQ